MARHKDVNWNLADDIHADGSTVGLARRQVAVLMDIRDELQKLNRIIGCPNFIDIPNRLSRIVTNTTKRKYTRRSKP